MANNIVPNAVRFIMLLLLQGLIFKYVSLGWGGRYYFHVFIYPLFILLMPLGIPGWVQLLTSFLLGLSVDFFYDSPGVHASALVFTAYVRSFIMTAFEPREGYNPDYALTPKRMGFPWFFRYASTLLGVHLLFYYSVEIFTFVYIGEILLRSILSYLSSIAFILMIMAIFNPKT